MTDYGAVVRRGAGKRFLCDAHLHTKTDRDKFLTKEELVAVLKAARRVSERDFSLLWICSVLGTRVAELVELRRCDFNLEQGVAWIDVRKRGKNARPGRIYSVIPVADRPHVETWVRKFKGSEYIFPGQRGGYHITARTAQLVFKRAARDAGILAVRPKSSIHSLRHTRAVLLLEQTGDVDYVQMMLRHQSRETTSQYLHAIPKNIRKFTDTVSLIGGS